MISILGLCGSRTRSVESDTPPVAPKCAPMRLTMETVYKAVPAAALYAALT
ncbi:MAG: hypothetical protein ABSE53_00810 [Terracidiphilus sp.]|jgi:hypothetical protein